MKILNFCSAKNTFKRIKKDKPLNWEKNIFWATYMCI